MVGKQIVSWLGDPAREAGRSNRKRGESTAFTTTFPELPCIGASGCAVVLADHVRKRTKRGTPKGGECGTPKQKGRSIPTRSGPVLRPYTDELNGLEGYQLTLRANWNWRAS